MLPFSCRTIAAAFDLIASVLFSLGVTHVCPVSVSSHRSARSRFASMLALTIALLSTMLASPAALAAGGTVIESFGSTSLVQVGNNFYFYPVGSSSGPLLKFRGAAVAIGQYPVTFLGVEKVASGYQIALRINGVDQYIVWNTDSSGNVVSDATGVSSSRVRAPYSNHLKPFSNKI